MCSRSVSGKPLPTIYSVYVMTVERCCPPTASDPQQWKAGSLGQTVGAFERTGTQSSHLLPDGTNA